MVLLVNLGEDAVPFFPNAENVKQLGYSFATAVEYGLAVRAGTPEAIRKKLEDTLKKVVEDPEIKEKMSGMGLTARFLDSKAFEMICIEAEKSTPDMIKYNKALPEG